MYINAASHYLPKTVISNAYYTNLVGLTDEWIYKRSGMRRRTRTETGENTNTMSIEAVKPVIDKLPYDISEVDLIVGATYTPYDTVGTLAHAVQKHFHIPRAIAVSVSSACSSFLNAMEIVEGYFASNKAHKAIVVVSEHNSSYSNDRDEKAGHLWGDGAAAIFISKERLTPEDLEVINIHTKGMGHVGKGLDGVWLRPNEGGLQMPHGRDIFTSASKYMASEVREILHENQIKLENIDYLIPHQANSRIMASVAEALGLPVEKVLSHVEETGNTGSASTAIVLSQNWDLFKKGDIIVITVFGGGYSSGAMILKKS